MAQMQHVRQAEAAGRNMDFERGYLESKVAALDAGIEALSPGLTEGLEPIAIPMFLARVRPMLDPFGGR